MAPDPSIAEEIRRYQAQYARNPDGFAFARLADAYRKAGDLARALELVDRGLERHPTYLSAHMVRARVCEALASVDQAVETYRRVLELDPQNLIALRALATLAWEAGRLQEAAAIYRRLREIDPLDEQARERIAEAERALARRAEADAPPTPRGENEAAAPPPRQDGGGKGDTDPAKGEDDLVVTATMGDLFLRQGLYEQAVRIFERLIGQRPDDPFLAEKLHMARRLASGRPTSGGTPGSGVPGGEEGAGVVDSPPGNGSVRASDAAARSGAATPAAASPPAPAPTIRAYLERLVEGRAEPIEGDAWPPGAPRFLRWLRRADELRGTSAPEAEDRG